MSEVKSRPRRLAYALSLLGAALFAPSPKVAAEQSAEIIAPCPQWLDGDATHLYWMSQHDDREVRKLALADGSITKLGKDCSASLTGSPIADREALYCIDGNWRNLLRIDKASGAKTSSPLGKQSIGPLILSSNEVYFAYYEGRDNHGIARLPKPGGAAQSLIEVSYPLPSFAADADGLVWLDAAGSVMTLAAGQKQPKTAGKLPDCAHDASIKAHCNVVADSQSIYVGYEPRCGSHDACPREVSRIDRLPRQGGAVQNLVGKLRMVHNLRLHAGTLFFSDCISGTISQLPRQGGARKSIEATGSCWAYSLGEREAFWFNGGKKLDWSDCQLRRVSYETFK